MTVGCPTCRTRFLLDDSKIKAERIVLRCSRCSTVFRISGLPPARPVSSSDLEAASGTKNVTVLVANESPDFCASVERVLAPEPFKVMCCHDGRVALDLIEKHLPDVVLVDVALPTVYGFEICERIRNNSALSSVKTILLASIYDKTRYKREPKALYGADDYIEKHHIPDSLAAKISCLVFGQSAVDQPGDCPEANVGEGEASGEAVPESEMNGNDALCEDLRKDEELKTSVASGQGEPESEVKARRLARIIVTDIALYNQKKVDEGIRNDTFYELLADDTREGRRLYDERVPEEIRLRTSFLEEAFEEFIARKKRELADGRLEGQ